MNDLAKRIGATFFICLVWSGLAFADEAGPKGMYSKVQHLNEGLVTLLRQNMQSTFAIQVDPKLLGNAIQSRHVYQLALSIELKLNAILQANGVSSSPTRRIMARPYSSGDVSRLLSRMQSRIDRLLSYYNVTELPNYKEFEERGSVDVYYALERMDRFLLKMGAPVVQPGHVLRRARALAGLAQKLCQVAACEQVRRRALAKDDVIIPAHVYQEAYRFIEGLNQYVNVYNISLPGGVLALKPQERMVQPAQVNKLMGVALADTIAVAKEAGVAEVVEFSDFNLHAIPRDVWREINFAQRLLKVAVQK
jgi:hypothetical protein